MLAVTAIVTPSSSSSSSYNNSSSSSSTPATTATGVHFEVQFLTRQLRQKDSFPLLQVYRSNVLTLNREQQCSVVVTRGMMSSDSNLFDGSFRLGYGGVYTGDISIDADAILVASQLSSLGVFNGLDLKVKRRELTSPSLELLSIEYQVEVMNENNWHLADQALRIRRYPHYYYYFYYYNYYYNYYFYYYYYNYYYYNYYFYYYNYYFYYYYYNYYCNYYCYSYYYYHYYYYYYYFYYYYYNYYYNYYFYYYYYNYYFYYNYYCYYYYYYCNYYYYYNYYYCYYYYYTTITTSATATTTLPLLLLLLLLLVLLLLLLLVLHCLFISSTLTILNHCHAHYLPFLSINDFFSINQSIN